MSAFNKMYQNTRDRNWGGTAATVACEPYISGYSYIMWKFPDALLWNIKNYMATIENDQTYTNADSWDEDILESAMVSVTPPGGTINKVTYQGLGGVKWSVPGSIDYGDNISLRYIEFSGLPISRIHRAWCNMIRDNKIGLTALAGNNGKDTLTKFNYNKADYSATLLYYTTKPDGVTVEHATAYSGVFPTKDPLDSFTGDITAIDKLEIDIDYNVDMIWHEDWVYQMARKHATEPGYMHGAPGETLWSRNGFRYQSQQAADYTDMPSNL